MLVSHIFVFDPTWYYVVFVDFCIVFYCFRSICENVISLVISVFFGNFAKVYLVFAGCFPSSVKFWVSVRRISTIEAVTFPETPRKNLPGRVTFVFPKQLSTLTLKNHSSGRTVFHIFHRIVHKFQWITLWKEWKTTLIFPKTTHFVSDRFPGKSKTEPWWKDLSHSTGRC